MITYNSNPFRMKTQPTQAAVFASGCFWCSEAVFKMIRGVQSVEPGYTGGETPNPTYEDVSTGATGHAEAVRVTYSPEKVTYEDLLTVFFASHDPTQVNRQGNDIGTQYRSAIFYANEDQRDAAEAFVADVQPEYNNAIATEVAPLTEFYPAEQYHHDYFENNPTQAYCNAIIAPKVAKMQERLGGLLKE